MRRRTAAAKRIGEVGGAAGLALLAAATAASAQVEQVRMEGTQDGEKLGRAVAAIGDLNGDGCDEWLVGAPDWSSNGYVKNGCARLIDGATGAILRSHFGTDDVESYGAAVAALGDVDADGVPDYACTISKYDRGWRPDAGRVEVFSGATGARLWTRDGYTSLEHFGKELCTIDDIDGDGIGELLASFYLASADAVDVLSGIDGTPLMTLDTPYLFLGSLARIGDVDGDGRRDFAIGYPFGWITSQYEGYVRIYSGASGAWIQTISGTGVDDGLGAALIGTEDLDHDGVEDFLVSAEISHTLRDGRIELRSGATLAVLRTIRGTSGSQLGRLLAAGGDWDGDSVEEHFAVSNTTAPNGSVHVFSGASGHELHRFDGEDTATSHDVGFGSGLAVGDWNSDGIGDLAIAADGWYGSSGADRGIAHAFLGCPASQSSYGVGFPGTLGTPTLSISGDPELGATLTFAADNSLGAATIGWVLIGDAAAAIPLKKGGTLLALPQIVLTVPIDANGFSQDEQLPDDPALGFSDFFLQIVQIDPGAAGGLSMTQGLQLRLGWDY